MGNERVLRILMLCATGVAFPFLLATTIVSLSQQNWWYGRDVTAFCFGYIPLAATVVLSLASLYSIRKNKKAPSRVFAFMDLMAVVSYLSVLLPIWIIEVNENGSAMALLTGYLTSMMLFNMFVHAYFFLGAAGATILAYFKSEPLECPNCHSTLSRPHQVAQRTQDKKTYTWLRGEDYLDEEDATPIMEPRVSEDTIASDNETVRAGDKGKSIVDV